MGAKQSSPQRHRTEAPNRHPGPGFHADQLAALEPLIAELSAELSDTTLLAWLYTPMALPLAEALGPEAMVYDCMDELSLFLEPLPSC